MMLSLIMINKQILLHKLGTEQVIVNIEVKRSEYFAQTVSQVSN
jgi:hypothetical protein